MFKTLTTAIFLLATLAWASSATLSSTSRHPGTGSDNVVAFDVICHLEIIDAEWSAKITVDRPNLDSIQLTVPFPNGTTEDAMATAVALAINHAADAQIATVEEDVAGPDKVVLSGDASVSASTWLMDEQPGPSDGHIKVIHSNKPTGPLVVPNVLWIEMTLQPFRGADILFTLTLQGKKPSGAPYLKSGSLQVDEDDSLAQAAQKIVNKLNQSGFNASVIPSGVRVDAVPGGPTIENYLVSIDGVLAEDASKPIHYGLKVDHGA